MKHIVAQVNPVNKSSSSVSSGGCVCELAVRSVSRILIQTIFGFYLVNSVVIVISYLDIYLPLFNN